MKTRIGLWLLLALCALLTFSFLFAYRPALAAAPGYRMQLVTAPGFLGGFAKTFQNVLEMQPCAYELLGWDADNWLYYEALCGSEVQVWQYLPTQSAHHLQVPHSPNTLETAVMAKKEMLDIVRATGVRPKKYESVTRPLLLKSEGIISPNGQWTALIVQHVYGPQDVVLLTKE
ncbi:MAG: hypothetical protein KDE56_00940 [Anaerolineales bacterium]|nr:hypothetical protein [Anaerolineales bacterium]